MNKLILSTFVLFISLCSFQASVAQSDQKADDIIQDSKKKFNGLSTISAQFTYTLTNPKLPNPIVKKGSVQFKKEKYHIKFADEEFFCDGKNVWVYIAEDEEVTITDYDPEESISIDQLYKIYENDAKSKYEGDMGTSHKVSVFMQDKEADVWKAEIWINKSTKLIEKAIMYSRTGTHYTYKLSNIKINPPLEDKEFIFDPKAHPDIYINDLTQGG